jgi:hypothetical protein
MRTSVAPLAVVAAARVGHLADCGNALLLGEHAQDRVAVRLVVAEEHGDGEALAEGVPLVCIPDQRDQPDNAARVVACGAGVRKRASPVRLREAIAAALEDPALERGARAMAQALARSNGALEVADAVEAIERTKA